MTAPERATRGLLRLTWLGPQTARAAIFLRVAAYAVLSACAETDRSPLHPLAVEDLGAFCHTGVVTMVIKKQGLTFAIETPDGRYHQQFARERFEIAPADLIETAGRLVLHNDGDIHEDVRSIRHLGKVSQPPPDKTSLAELVRNARVNRRATVEGTLVLARMDEIDRTFVQMLVKDGAAVLNASLGAGTNQAAAASIPLGARLRLTGVLQQRTGGARKNSGKYLLVDPDGGLEVVSPPPTDIFDAPAFNFDLAWTPDEILRM